MSDVADVARKAKAAARSVANAPSSVRHGALLAIADALPRRLGEILAANEEDVARARTAGMAEPLVDRLRLDEKRVRALAAAVREIHAQPDPLGEVLGMKRLANDLLAGQVRIPLGLVAMIYEARPNVTVDAAALCLKSGNAALLRGGSDARSSNAILGALVRDAVASVGLPADAVAVVPPLDRDATKALLALSGVVDLVIPRGGEGLIRFVTEHARVPVIQHFQGVCHLYADEGCDHDVALALLVNGKTDRPGTCNSTECCVVHEAEAATLVPRLVAEMRARGVEVRGCERTLALAPDARPAAADDFGREFLDLVLAVKVVPSFDAALDFIATHGSLHTEAIVTKDHARAQRFLREVDASCVLVNASTRFNDGGQLGLGAEIGISTSKLHAFGPMGAVHLTSAKWIVVGDGQVRR